MINARAESPAEKSTFKGLLKNRRCLVLADGFYEWRKERKGKVPTLFNLKSGEPLVFAGLWDTWKKPDSQTLRSYTIITTEPNEMLAPIHNHMPVMLSDVAAFDWLCGSEIDHALSLLKPFPGGLMDGYEVSKVMNNPVNDTSDCIAPAE